ncbi:MAG TPA: hypothetical protein VN429_06140 [Methanospirillum sp.]|uniref:hypothetical protein n=1 Tax=Methanospirillum sp. TaxID=45200 RepID=UPI002BBD287A|nr:hypothetical protein [Methanospirillum sp.]HWQ63978.1 hypothetical protein [Methanospirillum sp.]
MTPKVLYCIVILVCLIFLAGCTSEPSPISPASNSSQTPASTLTPVEPVHVNAPETPVPMASSGTIPDIKNPSPVPSISPVRTVMPDWTQDPLVGFRDSIILSLDNLQSGKEGLILTYRSGDIARVQQKANEYALMVRRNSELSDVPTKMDFVRLNYYDYIDQTEQVAKNFKDGAARYLASDKASATSFFEAGIMASDRADISDKRIRTFLSEHVRQVQINQT